MTIPAASGWLSSNAHNWLSLSDRSHLGLIQISLTETAILSEDRFIGRDDSTN